MSSGVYVPGAGGGFLHSGAEELDRQLREGDGILWTGDPHLELVMGVVEETYKGRKTGRVGRRYEVWRHMEDGRDELIGHWRMDEFHKILHDIVLMRAGFEGRAPSVLDRIDAHNAKIEKKHSDEYRDKMGEVLDWGARLHHDTTEGRSTFRQVGGFRDSK